MKAGYAPEAAIWYAADHWVIQEGAPKQREGLVSLAGLCVVSLAGP